MRWPLLLLLSVVLLSACAPDDPPEPVRLSGATMGTTWSVVLRPAPDGPSADVLGQRLQQRLDLLNSLMSTYDPASEVSRFNDHPDTGWFAVSMETLQVVELAQEISRLSGGAFDITVGPLVDLWGFGPKPRADLPSTDQVDAARARVGYNGLELRQNPAALRKREPDLEIDLSAVAKGYAVDVLGDLLESHGVFNYLLEIGGELRVAGERDTGTPWQIAIETPLAGGRDVAAVFALTDTSMAASGNYRNYYEVDGQMYSHAIDPVSGRPVHHRLAAVTVLEPNCGRADALATALMVLGEERGRAFCDANGIAAYFQIHGEGGLATYATPDFERQVTGNTR